MLQLQQRKAESTIDLDSTHLCITLQNFGGKAPTPKAWGTTEFSFFRDDDALSTDAFTTLDTLGDSADHPEDPDNDYNILPYMQPWMQTAVGIYDEYEQRWIGGAATEWMEEYLDALAVLVSNAEGLPPISIARFHCEVETSLTQGLSDTRMVQVMLACEQDDRWDTMPVPGFGGDTMLEIWHDAQDFYGWRDPADPYFTLADVLNVSQDANVGDNLPYYTWWIDVYRRALDGAIKITCYDVIDNHPIYGGAKHSNYGYANMDMGQDTFAFRKTDSVSDPTSTWYRGNYDFNFQNAYPQLLTTTTPPLAYGMAMDVSSGDFDAPVLPYGDVRPEWLNLRQPRWYEPPDAFTGLPRLETTNEFYQRTHRHRLDAVLNTPTKAPDGVTPWIDVPNVYTIEEDGNENGIDETRRVLALLRSKDIREILVWGNKPVAGNPARGSVVDWNDLKRADAQVYTPYIKSVELVRGVADAWSEQALNTTLRWEDPAELKIGSELAGNPSNHQVTEIVVRFNNVRPVELGNNGRLVLECRIDPSNPSEFCTPVEEPCEENVDHKIWREACRGQISIWNEQLGQWDPVETVSDSADGEYRFYVGDDNAWLGSSSTRREWDLGYDAWEGMCPYLSEQGSCEEGAIAFKFTHLAPELPSGFSSSYDLIMFYHLDDVPDSPAMLSGSSSSTASSQAALASIGGFLPADFNFDGLQDSTDAEMFTAAWTNGERRADYNADGEVDALDLTQFLNALGRATAANSGGLSEE